MKRNFVLALAVLPLLAACSDGEVATTAAVTETVTVDAVAGDAPATVTETVTVTAPAPEGESDMEASEVAATGETEATEAEATAENAEADPQGGADEFGQPVRSDRGFLVKDVGQLAGVQAEDGTPLVNFTLTEVETDFSCTSDWGDPSKNGQFVAFTFEVETFPAMADEDNTFHGSFSMHEYYLAAFSADGVRANDISGNAWSCLDSPDGLPSEIGPGQKATGKVVIDTGLESGVLVYQPLSWDGNLGWEWKF